MRTHGMKTTLGKGRVCCMMFLSMMVAYTSEAQFNTPSPGRTVTTDNVGIGILSPGSKLHVESGFSNVNGTWSGLPALKMDWNMPSYYTSPGPSGTPPNVIEVLGITSTPWPGGSGTSITPFMTMNYNGQLGLKTWPAADFALNVGGKTNITDALTIGGTTSYAATDKLTVKGDLTLTKSTDAERRNIKARSRKAGLHLAANTDSWDGATVELYGPDASGTEGQVRLVSYGNGNNGGIKFLNYSPVSSNWTTNMGILPNGQVYIGDYKPSNTFDNYKLGVDGDIVCKRMVVQTSNWADFVFAPDYKLPELSYVEAFISKNGHLPGIPDEQSVLEKGVDVGDMNRILLQKIEELTLYMIEVKKENEELKNAFEQLKK